jgi:hypothetical protein
VNGAHEAVDSVTQTIGAAASSARGPLIAGGAAAAGAIGGFVLGGRVLRPGTKLLGIPLAPSRRSSLTDELVRTGKHLGHFAEELAKARAQARRVGKALS